MLPKIPYTSSAAVLIAYKQTELPPGFGFLVPRPENRKILACTFVHKKFSYRVPEGGVLLRCFFSSSRMPDLLENQRDRTHTRANSIQTFISDATSVLKTKS